MSEASAIFVPDGPGRYHPTELARGPWWTSHRFINPDLTIYVERLADGEWVGLDASTRVGDAGAGLTDSLLFDTRGRLGRALQGLYVAER